MRLNQFLEKLSQTPRTWYVYDGCIRCQDFDTKRIHCPLSAIALKASEPEAHYGAQMGGYLGVGLGLSIKTVERILAAADDNPKILYPTLRKRLLKACGLTRQRYIHTCRPTTVPTERSRP